MARSGRRLGQVLRLIGHVMAPVALYGPGAGYHPVRES
jgi:hypothetical protein